MTVTHRYTRHRADWRILYLYPSVQWKSQVVFTRSSQPDTIP